MKIDLEKCVFSTISRAESPIHDYKCSVKDCSKTFRKSHLLEAHMKYFHNIRSSQKKTRSCIALSSSVETSPMTSVFTIDSSPKVVLTSFPTGEEPKTSSTASSEVDFTEQSDSALSDTDSESEDESPSVDDCVKCACLDECELGFMIQCEQCFTWQHGECVGYSQPKSVPLFYLCHICSRPKELRRSCQYNNDYTWYRHGLLPPIRQDAPDDAHDDIDASRHYDLENEETLSSIILASHAMMTDLYNVRDILNGIRNKFNLVNQRDTSNFLEYNGSYKSERYSALPKETDKHEENMQESLSNLEEDKNEKIKQNTVENVTDGFDTDFNDILFSINNRESNKRSLSNESIKEMIFEANCEKSEFSKKKEPGSLINEIENQHTNLENIEIDDVSVVVSKLVHIVSSLVCDDGEQLLANQTNKVNYENELNKMKKGMMNEIECTEYDNTVDYVEDVPRCNFVDTSKFPIISSECSNNVYTAISSKCSSNVYSAMPSECSNNVYTAISSKCSSNVYSIMPSKCSNNVSTAISSKCSSNVYTTMSSECSSNVYTAISSKCSSNVYPTMSSECSSNVYTAVSSDCSSNVYTTDIIGKGDMITSCIEETGIASDLLIEQDKVQVSNSSLEVFDEGKVEESDIANTSEDSIPYMETGEGFYPNNNKGIHNNVCNAESMPLKHTETFKPFFGEDYQLNSIFNVNMDWSGSSKESLLARYNLLLEIERIEDLINERLEDMHSKLDELEAEYDSIDKSKQILDAFKSNFKLLDIKSLMAQLNKVKWHSIINSSNGSYG